LTDREERIRAKLDAPAQAARMRAELERRVPGGLATVREGPLEWLRTWPEIELIERDSMAESTTSCDVAGSYDPGHEPPRVIVRRSGFERMQFTALHEVGHHLQQSTDDLIEVLAARGDVGVALEERAADQFAASVLIPEATASRILGSGNPSAEAAAELWRELSHASRQAVVVRTAMQLEADGQVLLLDSDGRVEFSCARGAFQLAHGSDQSGTEIWRRIAAAPTRTVTARGRFAYRGLLGGDDMYSQAVPVGQGHHLVVAAVERVPWQLSVNVPEYKLYGRMHTCERSGCGKVFTVAEVCDICGQPRCPECGWCSCRANRLSEFTCTECFLVKSMSELSMTAGICTECVR
jgi:hypothetical protein